MALFRSERGIGRGEIAESRLEFPIFAMLMLLCCVGLLVVHFYLGNQSVTLALAISLLVFGATVVRVEFGVCVLVVAMLLSPEIDAGNELSGERNLNLRYDDVLILVIFLGVMVKLAFEGQLRLWQPSPVNAGIVAYFSVCIISTLLALERNLGAWDRRTAFFTMLKMLEYYMIFFLVGHAVRNLKSVRRQMALFFVVALIVSVYGIYTIGTTPRVGAPLEQGGTEPNTLGGYLTLVICLAVGLLTQARQFQWKLIMLGISGIAFIPFLYTLSRASYIALLVGLVVLGVVSRKFIILAVLGAVLASSTFIMPEKVIERVSHTFQKDTGESITLAGRETGVKVDKSTHERFLVWRKVRFILTLSLPFALLGAGVSWESVLDSQYARVFLETGLLGAFAFAFLLYRLLRTSREAYRWTGDWVGRGIGIGMFAATLALIAHAVGTISFLIVRIMEPYWFLVAITVIVRNQAIETHRMRAIAQRHTVQTRMKPSAAGGSSPALPTEA